MSKLVVWIVILAFWLIPKLINAFKKAGQSGKQTQSTARPAAAPRQTPSVQMNRPAPSMDRPAPAAKKTYPPRSAKRDFSAPEAPCIVCEQTGEDHFQRDKARRLAQLDDWLKIGLIDRDEDRVMRDRYERGI